MNLEELRDLLPEPVFPADLLRQSLRPILRAMHFLHEEVHVIHTDIQPKNILFGILDDSAFVRFENDEREYPMPRKEVESGIVYMSHPMPLTKSAPSLCDLSEARFDRNENVDLVMPDLYRAPEVVLGMPWSYPVDAWGFAMTLWDLFEPKRLFAPHGKDGRYSEHRHLAQMISIMGPPPLDFLQRSEKSKLFWNEEGEWKGDVPIPETSLALAGARLQGEEKELFMTFMRKMLRWKPEDREDLHGVFVDEWLLADLIAAGEVVREESVDEEDNAADVLSYGEEVRRHNMAESSGIDSPDPLALPSSPLHVRSTRQPSIKPPASRSSNANASPSKSFILDTGNTTGTSPWRIKVTVEAEPQDVNESSPIKRKPTRRARKVPLKGAERGGSPEKKAAVQRAESPYVYGESEGEVKRPQRKRKGTPIRRRSTRTAEASEQEAEDKALMPPPTSSATKARRRRSLNLIPTTRSKRLSQAREELDLALQDAVGTASEDGTENEDRRAGYSDAPGDMTVAGDEDFTMVSVETLQSLRGDTSFMSRHGEGDRSGLSVSYLPSSPPKGPSPDKVQYPDLSDEVRRMAMTPLARYDAMSWARNQSDLAREDTRSPQSRGEAEEILEASKRTSPAASPENKLNSEPSEWRRAREAVSRQIEQASRSQVIVVEDDTVVGAFEEEEVQEDEPDLDQAHRDGPEPDENLAEDADIWQEEASRSLEDDLSEENVQRPTRPSQLRLQLVGKAPKASSPDPNIIRPPRAKLPRTWRRSSGVDFSYSDSPAHSEHPEPAPLHIRKRDASTDGGSRASSGVLTPPSTDDEEAHRLKGDEEEIGQQVDSDISLTRPDAEATQLVAQREETASPVSDSPSSDSNPDGDGEDTGLFWQSNMPHVYQRPHERGRPQRQQRAMDLSELLGLHGSGSANKVDGSIRSLAQTGTAHSPLQAGPAKGRIKGKPSDMAKSKLISSPLRKSLLRSSKMPESPLTRGSRGGAVDRQQADQSWSGEVDESWQSKASDQRQLLGEMAVAGMDVPRTRQLFGREAVDDEPSELDNAYEEGTNGESEKHDESYADGYDHGTEDYNASINALDPSQSYEEHLNIESPQKIRVKFNDSEGNSSLLAHRREYAPLFKTHPQQPHASPPTLTLVSNRQRATAAEAGIFSRLTTNFWSAVVRPIGPTEILPPRERERERIQEAEPIYSPSLRAHIRSRYGVLPSTHPWTMCHMRTLHRMVNSCEGGKSDSIIPRSGPLPIYLKGLVGTRRKSVTGYEFEFEGQHAHVVDAFLQVLVPAHVVEAMKLGEVEALGDATALEYRGLIAGRHGDDLVYSPTELEVWENAGEIRAEFVVAALGDVVRVNVASAN